MTDFERVPANPPDATGACHAVAVSYPVADPRLTASRLADGLGFVVRESRGDGSVVVDNGAIAIRLAEAGEAEPPELEFEVETDDLELACEQLRVVAGVVAVAEDRRIGEDRIVRRVALEGGVVVSLTRVLDEDDLGILPPLPANLVWDENTDLLVRRVLRAVPLTFRPSARARVTERAEAVALESGDIEIGLDAAIQGLFDATPEFEHATLRQTLAEEGVDLEHQAEVPHARR